MLPLPDFAATYAPLESSKTEVELLGFIIQRDPM